MTGHDAPRAREEAERLVASVLAAVTFAARGLGAGHGASAARAMGVPPEVAGLLGRMFGPNVATGAPECCVCPICRTIAALRDPDPEVAERLATGVGDLAAGVANLLRAFSAGAQRRDASTDTRTDTRTDTPTDTPTDTRTDTATGAGARGAAGEGSGGKPPDGDAHDDPWHAATTADRPADG
ncbi:MAG TPA: hypothetical protein VF054_09610 [Micromonosporaceae bacterium]